MGIVEAKWSDKEREKPIGRRAIGVLGFEGRGCGRGAGAEVEGADVVGVAGRAEGPVGV